MLRRRTVGSEIINSENSKPEIHHIKSHFINVRSVLLNLTKILILCYIAIPFCFYSFKWLRCLVIFQNYVNFSPTINFSQPESAGFPCARNFYLPSNDDVTLGVWHIYPFSLKDSCEINTIFNTEFNDDRSVVLYLHGSGGNRGARHRRAMYKILSQSNLDFHVITFDYRGFGDSTNKIPTAEGVVNDSYAVYEWLKDKVKSNRIYLWCHSLGSAICLRLVSTHTINAAAVILESSIASVYKCMYDNPLTIVYRYMPFYKYLFEEPITQHPETNFSNEELIRTIQLPVLILHAADDTQVPHQHADDLYRSAIEAGVRRVKYICYEASLEYGHLNIWKDPDLPNKITSFINSVR